MPYLLMVGNDGVFDEFPLGVCQGDCDDHSDCQGDLMCMQRIADEPVPGCQGRTEFSVDYCVRADFMATSINVVLKKKNEENKDKPNHGS